MKTKYLLLFAITICGLLSFSTKKTKSDTISYNTIIAGEINYAGILGKDVDSPEAKVFISTLKGKTEVNRDVPDFPHLMYLEEGVEIIVNKDYAIHAIFLCNPNIFYKTGFKGYLPYGLKMTDTREQVEAKLGKGEAQGGHFNVDCSWKTKNIQIDYKGNDIADMQNKIVTIQFRTWEK